MIKIQEIDLANRYGGHKKNAEEEVNKFLKENDINEVNVINVTFQKPWVVNVVYRD